MRKTVSNLLVVGTQLLIVGLFFTTILSNDMKEVKHVSTIHNNNLNKIATSVSLLFEEENLNNSIEEIDKKLEEMVIEELPSVDVVYEDSKKNADEIIKEDDSNKSTPLVSIDADKYINKTNVGFNVTENNKNYTIDGYEFDVVVAVVAAEYHENSDQSGTRSGDGYRLARAGHRTLRGTRLSGRSIQLAGAGDLREYHFPGRAVYLPDYSGSHGLKFAMRRANFIFIS